MLTDMLYTSYFGLMKKFPDTLVPVAICLYPPKWYRGLVYSKLAPTKEILEAWKLNKDERAYINAYATDVLSLLTPEEVQDDLITMVGEDKDVAMLCYEKEGFCHRHLVANWLTASGITTTEILYDKGDIFL